MTRPNSLPSDTATLVVAEIGSLMPLLTLLSARSTVARICTGPGGKVVPDWNDTVAMPAVVFAITLDPLPPFPESMPPPASPTIS